MKVCRMVALCGLLCAITAGIACRAQELREPSIEGKQLSVWLDAFQASIPKPEYEGNPQMRVQARDAVLKIGTNSIPWLLQELSAKEKTKGDELPANFTSGEAIKRRWRATAAFEILGSTAKDATPRLIRLLEDKQTSYTAAMALGGIGTESIPVLTRALTNVHTCARESSARVLGLFGAKAKIAVPALVQCTKDPDNSVRGFAAFALKQIDPEAAANVGTTTKRSK